MPAIGLVVFVCGLIMAALTPAAAVAPSASMVAPTSPAPESPMAAVPAGASGVAVSPSARPVPTPTTAPVAATAPETIEVPVVPLGSRPESTALSYWGDCPAVIEGLTFRGLGPGVIAIRLEACSNVLIRNNDFIDVAEAMYVLGGSNINVIDNRFQNIVGPSVHDGGVHGNFVMFNGVVGGLIARNEGRCGDTEDTISVYRSSHVIVAANYLEGAFEDAPGCLAWRSASGTGINVNDGGGTGNVVRDNILVNPHRVGIGVAGGSDTLVEYNTVYSASRQDPDTVLGIGIENYSGQPCIGITIRGNRVQWTAASGQPFPIWASSRCQVRTDRRSSRNDRTLDPATLLDSYRASIGTAEAAAEASEGPEGLEP